MWFGSVQASLEGAQKAVADVLGAEGVSSRGLSRSQLSRVMQRPPLSTGPEFIAECEQIASLVNEADSSLLALAVERK
jgi:hypothetical protein